MLLSCWQKVVKMSLMPATGDIIPGWYTILVWVGDTLTVRNKFEFEPADLYPRIFLEDSAWTLWNENHPEELSNWCRRSYSTLPERVNTYLGPLVNCSLKSSNVWRRAVQCRSRYDCGQKAVRWIKQRIWVSVCRFKSNIFGTLWQLSSSLKTTPLWFADNIRYGWKEKVWFEYQQFRRTKFPNCWTLYFASSFSLSH